MIITENALLLYRNRPHYPSQKSNSEEIVKIVKSIAKGVLLAGMVAGAITLGIGVYKALASNRAGASQD